MTTPCAKSTVGLFESVLIVNDTINVNNIQPKTTGGSVVVAGHTPEVEFVMVDMNANGALLTASPSLYAYVADRPVVVLSVREIHSVASADEDSEINVLKRLVNGTAVNIITAPIDPSQAADVQQTTTLEATANITLAKGYSIFITGTGTLAALEGCVISILLQLPLP
jgi:hypothetical protein